jgi:hypothetical protein
MTLTLLEAGEKITNPPMIATQEAVRSDIDIAPGGVTWVDIEYDERLGSALRPITTRREGHADRDRHAARLARDDPAGVLPEQDRAAAHLEGPADDRLPGGADHPAVDPRGAAALRADGARVQRQLCEESFGLLRATGPSATCETPALAPGRERSKFRFKSPLHDVIEQQKGQKFLEMKQLLAEAVAMDPACAYLPDT